MNLNWFQTGVIPTNAMSGSYDYKLVLLSYVIAVLASYVALDIAGFLRTNAAFEEKKSINIWLLVSAFSMGAGIWSMHFIGMLAFTMSMPMSYAPFWTAMSMIVAIAAAWLALFLFTNRAGLSVRNLALGGIVLGIAIASMHYLGMIAMTPNMIIRYTPGLFFLSIIIALCASEAALWMSLRNKETSLAYRIQINVISAIIMGAAIAGMHYTGMAAAVFLPNETGVMTHQRIDTSLLGLYIAIITVFIITGALVVSTYKQLLTSRLHANNSKLKITQYALKELNSHLEKRINDRTQDLKSSLSLLKSIFEATSDGFIVVKSVNCCKF